MQIPVRLDKALSALTLSSLLGFSFFYRPEIAWAKKGDRDNTQGFPTRRVGGGTRGCPLDRENNCLSLNQADRDILPNSQNSLLSSLVALIPEDLAIVSQASPTLYFYLPQIEHPQDVRVEFVLRDESDRQVYQETFSIEGKAGIIGLKIANSPQFSELALEQNYHWYLSIIYNPSDRADDEVVEGWVRRITLEPNLAQQLERMSPLERVNLYREAGLWYEALATLADLKRSQPDDDAISAMWVQLLEAIDLESVARIPLL